MKLVLEGSVRESRGEFVASESPWGRTVLWLVFLAIGSGWCAAPLLHPVGWVGAIFFGLPCMLAVGLSGSGVFRLWRRGGWTLRVRREALIVRLRSQLNDDLPNEWANVVVIEREDVVKVRAERTDLRDLTRRTGSWSPRTALVIELRSEVPAQVVRALEREVDPGIRNRTHFRTRIASVETPNEFRVVWLGSSTALRPSVRRALRALERAHYPVDHEITRITQRWSAMDDSQRDDCIERELRGGDKLRAIQLWRERHGGSLSEAKAAVEQLSERIAA